ncbi:MAG: HAMP domain-containing protein [Nitrospirae bacterium]|nr:HAMP domain-containing protein [Nitrospirota bacterium]
MTDSPTFKFQYKVIALVAGVVIALTAAVSYVSIYREERIKRQEQERQMVKMANVIASFKLIEPLTGRQVDWGTYQRFLDVTGSLEPDVVAVGILDGEGALRAYRANEAWVTAADPRGAPDLPKTLRAGLAEGSLRSAGGDLALIDGPIAEGGRPVAVVRIAFSLSRMKREIRGNRQTYLAIALSVLGLGLAAGIVLARGVTRPLETLAGKMQRVAGGDFTERMTIFPRDEVGTLARAFNGMVEGLIERDRIKAERDRFERERTRYRETLQRYVSRQVAERILKEHGTPFLKGERRDVTVLFSDIRGFTRMSERMEPEEVVDLLNEYFSRTIDIIFKYDGMLDKFIGDCVMAVFGAPEGHADDAVRAVKTAVEMREAVRFFNEHRAREGKEPIRAGIGINSGHAVAGSIGSQQRMEYTVIGDEVNLASRLTANAAGGQILLSEQTFRRIRDLVSANPLPPIRVKGKDAPVILYELIGLSAEEPSAGIQGGNRS